MLKPTARLRRLLAGIEDLGRQLRWTIRWAGWGWLLKRFARCRDRKPLLRVLGEMARAGWRFKCLPDHYFRYELYRRHVPAVEVARWQSDFDYYARLSSRWNRHRDGYHVVLKIKTYFHRLMQAAGIPTPPLVCSWMNGLFAGPDGCPEPPEQILGRLQASGPDCLVCKPEGGGAGTGVVFWSRRADGYVDQEGRPVDAACLEARAAQGDGLLEEGVVQHAVYAAFHPASVNTLRMVTERGPDGCRVRWAVLRMGTGGRHVDNACKGGIYCGVSLEDGHLQAQAWNDERETFERHPDTGVVFEGQVLPYTREAVALCRRAAMRVPYCPCIGWDIACTPDGPVILEGNQHWSLSLAQNVYGGIAGEFGCQPGGGLD